MGSNETLIITEIDVNDGPKMPYRTPSGVVALATLAAVIAVFLISIVIYYYKTYIVNTYSRLNRQIKKKRRTSTAEVNDDEFQPEKLREDSVINHELDFNPDAFSYAGDVENSRKKPVPSPCPSIFADDLFLEEVMTSVADICSASKSMDRTRCWEPEKSSKRRTKFKRVGKCLESTTWEITGKRSPWNVKTPSAACRTSSRK